MRQRWPDRDFSAYRVRIMSPGKRGGSDRARGTRLRPPQEPRATSTHKPDPSIPGASLHIAVPWTNNVHLEVVALGPTAEASCANEDASPILTQFFRDFRMPLAPEYFRPDCIRDRRPCRSARFRSASRICCGPGLRRKISHTIIRCSCCIYATRPEQAYGEDIGGRAVKRPVRSESRKVLTRNVDLAAWQRASRPRDGRTASGASLPLDGRRWAAGCIVLIRPRNCQATEYSNVGRIALRHLFGDSGQ